MVPISKDLVATHVTRVTRVNSLVRVRSDAAILLCYNKSIATVDSNEWRADSYFDRHTLPVPPPRITRSNASGSVFPGKWVAKLFCDFFLLGNWLTFGVQSRAEFRPSRNAVQI